MFSFLFYFAEIYLGYQNFILASHERKKNAKNVHLWDGHVYKFSSKKKILPYRWAESANAFRFASQAKFDHAHKLN